VATETVPDVERPRTAEEIERHWFENVYQGDRMPQLTARAVVMGMLLGMVLACSNVYVGLKAGWSMGVAITACILAYVIFEALHRAFPKWFGPYSILENNAMQSCASAAGYMSGAGLVNAIPALMMLNPGALPATFGMKMLYFIPWLAVISWLGVFLAVPAKRQMINIEQLPYPSGIAAATTLRTLHEKGGAAAEQAKLLGVGGLAGVVVTFLRDFDFSWTQTTAIAGAAAWLPIKNLFSFKAPWLAWLKLPRVESTWGTNSWRIGTWKGAPLFMNQVTMSFEGSLLFIAAGAIIGFRQAWSLMLGAVVNYVFLAPIMLNGGDISAASFRRISAWSLWTGVPMLVTSGLLLFFMNWKSVVRAFSTITAFFNKQGAAAADDPMNKIEVPGSWFIGGVLVLGTATVILANSLFHVVWWMGVIAVLATFFLVVVAARATGETDITPTGPLSKITQLTFGAIKPGDISTNLMTANITAGSCSHAGDLLTDLKSGYLLGANPRQQFIAQFFGVFAGGLAVVPIYFILIPDASLLGGEKWPAPAALVWRGVAELLSKGVGALPPTARIGLAVGAVVGIALPLLEKAFPKQKKFIPSATGLGLAFTINGFNSVSMFLGALAALLFTRFNKKLADKTIIPVSSGIIAGESLMGVGIAMLNIFKP
jgi:OPT family oligopeptide transporter